MKLIGLEAAVDAACNAVEHFPSEWEKIEAEMRKLPVVEERKHGHWIETNEYYTGAYESLYYYKCSVCGALILEDVDFGVGNYCQQCGAKMDEEEKADE